MNNRRKSSGKKNFYSPHLTISVVATICYFNSLFGEFVFDDVEAIVKNKDVLPSTPISETFLNDFWGTKISSNLSHKSYRPLTILTYRINIYLDGGKLNTFHFHLTNVILYIILCSMLLPFYKLCCGERKILKNDKSAFFAALLFTVHPIHTEVVSSLVGRADILSAILFLLSVLLYREVLNSKSIFLYLLVILIISAAVLCKETAISALVICSLYDIFYTKLLRKQANKEKSLTKHFIIRNLGLILSGGTIIFLRLYVMNFRGPSFTKSDNPAAFAPSFTSKFLSYNYNYFLNFLLLLWPHWLCFDWSMGCIPLITDFCDIRVIFVVLFWIFLIIQMVLLSYRYIFAHDSCSTIFSLLIMLISFIPASNIIVTVGFVIAERTLLIPSIGYCMLVVLGFEQLNKLLPSYSKEVKLRVFYFICFILTIRTIERNFQWLNEEVLFNSALKVCPLNAKVHYNVAKIAADKYDNDLAIAEYNLAIRLNPDYEQAMNNLANLLRERRKFVEAEVLLRKAISIRPNFAAAWMNLGILLINLNKTSEAEECYLKAINFRPKYSDCYYNLGNLYLDLKRNKEALKAWEMSVKFRPTHTAAWSNSLVLLDSLGKLEEVLERGKIALMHNPKSPVLHFSIGNTLGKMKEFEKAEKHFLEALNFNPYNALYYSNLGVLYHRWGKTEKARESYKRALQIDPKMKTAENNLKKLLSGQK